MNGLLYLIFNNIELISSNLQNDAEKLKREEDPLSRDTPEAELRDLDNNHQPERSKNDIAVKAFKAGDFLLCFWKPYKQNLF